jgi:hypothetical protein
MAMTYQEARRIKNKSLKDLIAQNIVSGQGFGSSVGTAISDKIKAKGKRIQAKFDPLNIAKMLTGSLGAAILGRLTGRKQEDLEYFTNMKSRGRRGYYNNIGPTIDTSAFYTKISEGQNQKMRRGDSVADILAKMFNFMKKSHDEEIKAMELARDLEGAKKGGKASIISTPKPKTVFEKIAEKTDDFSLADLLKKLFTIISTLASAYGLLKGLLRPFLDFLGKIRLPKINFGLSRTPTPVDAEPKPKVENEEERKNREQREKENREKNKASNSRIDEESERGKPTSSKVTPEAERGSKPGFQKDALDKIRERAERIAGDTAKRKAISKLTGKALAKKALTSLNGPLTIAMLAYDVADALAPTEQEALNTNFDELLSIKDDMERIQNDFNNGLIKNPKVYEDSMKGLNNKAKTIEQRIKVLKDKTDEETYKMEAQLNQESAEDGKLTIKEKVKGLGANFAQMVHDTSKQIKGYGKDTATALHSFSLSKTIANDPLVKFFQANEANQTLNLSGATNTIVINKPTTNNMGDMNDAPALILDNPADVRNDERSFNSASKQSVRVP